LFGIVFGQLVKFACFSIPKSWANKKALLRSPGDGQHDNRRSCRRPFGSNPPPGGGAQPSKIITRVENQYPCFGGFMLSVYFRNENRDKDAKLAPIHCVELGAERNLPSGAIWIDLFKPTEIDDHKVETYLDIDIPTLSDVDYVEPVEALYADRGSRFLSAKILCGVNGVAQMGRVTFIMTSQCIVTVRNDDCDAFSLFSRRLAASDAPDVKPETILAGLINTIVNRMAHEIELIDKSIEAVSTSVFNLFEPTKNQEKIVKSIFRSLGVQSTRVSNVRESLVSLERVLLFILPEYEIESTPAELRDDVRATLRDLQSLEEHASFQTQKVQFLLDTTLGLINLTQSHIIKLFSVLAVIFMPPTLIASIYGMNFKHMPELDWVMGYPLALALMILSSTLLYIYFRWKRWL
jgi:magnesium transporter